jgi:hypothetical protein
MLTSLLLGAAVAAPGAPIPTDTDAGRTGPAPWVLHLRTDDSGRAQIMVYKNQKVTRSRSVVENVNGKPTTKIVTEEIEQIMPSYVMLDSLNPKFTTAQGTPLSAEQVLKRAKDGMTVLVSADNKPVGKNWLRSVDPETVIVSAEGLISVTAPRSAMYEPMTAAPRLVLLAAGADGKVQVAYNPSTNNGGAYMGRGGRMVFLGNGQAVMMDDEYYYPQQPPANTEAPVKPLEDVKFEAYDLNGKSVPRAEALKRLTAGGYALIAGDSRVPDENFLNRFRGDLLVLVSAELLNVPVGKKGAAPTAVRAVPVPAVVAPALVAAPAQVLVKPALRVAPAVEKVEKPVAPAPREKK